MGHLSSNMDVRLKATPNLQLLFELEPAYRVFFRNLADTLLRRPVPPVVTKTRPGHFWNDVFVPIGLPWGAFMESMLWHLAVVSVLWTVAQTWVKQVEIQQRRASHDSLTYTPPPKTFPALGGRPAPVRERHIPNINKSPLRVARERNPSEMKPPDLKVAQSQRPNVTAGLPSSAMPLFAPKLRESTVPTGPANAVAPAPNIKQATNRRLNLPQDSAVAPAANVGSVSSRRAMATPTAAVVPPAPNLQASTAKLSDARIANPQVVAPTPQLDVRGGISARQSASLSLPHPVVVMPSASVHASGLPGNGRLNSGVDLPVVPPAPSGQGVGSFSRNKPVLSLSGSTAISPSPSLRAAKGLSGGGRSNSLSGRDTSVVPPPPSVGSGISTGGARVASLSATGSSVVPPPASIGGSNSVAGGKGISVSVGERRVIPPAPSLGGTGNSTGGGRDASLSGGGQQALPPASSLQDTLSAIEKGSAGNGSATSDGGAAPSPPTIDSGSNVPATIELPIRVIGLAVSLPNSSYFSNYEVFIAERRLKKGTPELIKLVYESLPYQPRLTDYGLDNSKVYRLRVTRDPACDETLLQMTWPQTDEKHSGSKYATGPPALAPSDRNDLLPCYRTTADDYRRAVTQDR